MNPTVRLLELAGRTGREVAERLPEEVLRALVEAAGAGGGRLGCGDRLLAETGAGDGAVRRVELPAGRDAFWVAVDAGDLDEVTRQAAAVVLGGWQVREELKSARFAERRRLWEVESLRAIGEALGGTLEPMRIAEELLLHATALLDARRGEVWLSGQGAEPAVRLAGAQATAPCRDGSCTVAARIGGPVLTVEEAQRLGEAGLLEEGRLAVPIGGRRGRIGVVALAEREVRGGTAPFAATDVETLSLFSAQAAVALENANLYRQELERQRLERELELAASIQRQLLPRAFPPISGAHVAARSESSRHVGGDIYDLIPEASGAMLMLADLSGKGVPAALMASSLHAAVHILAQQHTPVAELANRLHAHLLAATPDNKYATVFLGRLDDRGRLEYVSAGHNPAVLVLPGGRLEWLGATGTPLGLLRETLYESRSVELPAGSLLVVYTDGFTEAPGAEDGEDFGMEALAELVRHHADRSLEEVLDAMFLAVRRHTDGAPPHDDRTALLVRRLSS